MLSKILNASKNDINHFFKNHSFSEKIFVFVLSFIVVFIYSKNYSNICESLFVLNQINKINYLLLLYLKNIYFILNGVLLGLITGLASIFWFLAHHEIKKVQELIFNREYYKVEIKANLFILTILCFCLFLFNISLIKFIDFLFYLFL